MGRVWVNVREKIVRFMKGRWGLFGRIFGVL